MTYFQLNRIKKNFKRLTLKLKSIDRNKIMEELKEMKLNPKKFVFEEYPGIEKVSGLNKIKRTSSTTCSHEATDKIVWGVCIFPRSPLYFGHLCKKCGVLMIDCKYEVETINKYLPYYWKYLEYQQSLPYYPMKQRWIIADNPCKFCNGIYDAELEDYHSQIRALEILKEKYREEFNFFYASEYSDYVLLRILRGKRKYFDDLEARELIDDILEPHTKIHNRCFFREGKDYYRDKFKLPRVGEKWFSETYLYKRVKELFPTETVRFHSRPKFLKGLEIDIYLPSSKIGIEYQGRQHYEPVDFFGGMDSYLKTVERDQKKRSLCEENDIKLVFFKYDEPVDNNYIKEKLSKT